LDMSLGKRASGCGPPGGWRALCGRRRPLSKLWPGTSLRLRPGLPLSKAAPVRGR
jgi:hypothetical protein